MQEMVNAWFTGGPSFRQSEEPASLLEGWKQYEARSQGMGLDLEGQGQSSSLAGSGLEGVNTYFRSASESASGAWNTVSKNVQDLPSSIHKTATTMPSQRQFLFFLSFLGSGLFFTSLSFTIFLPLIAVAPQKFAICFTIGSILIMGAFFALKGPQAQLESMLSKDRLPFTTFYIGSMISTLYVSMVMHSYLLSVLSSGAQVLALGYYVISFFPGGTSGLNFVTSTVTNTFRGVTGI